LRASPVLLQHVRRAVFWSLCHLGVAFAVTNLIRALHLDLDPSIAPYFTIVQPASGVRVLVAWLYGWTSVLYLAPAMLVMLLFGYANDMVALKEPVILVGVVVSAPLAFSILNFSLGKAAQPSGLFAHWRPLLMVGFLAGVLKATAIMTVLFDVIPPERHLFSLLQIIVGSLSGTMVVLVLTMFFFRWQRFYQQWRRGSVAGDGRH
jgi:hypothetical protein